MDKPTFLLALLSLLGWGVGAFLAKLAADRIGEKSVLWDMLGYVPAILIYSFVFFKVKDLLAGERIGILLAFLSGAVGSLGAVAFYILLTKKDASTAVPLTALYPALTALLAFIFLGESLTPLKIAGIAMAAVALYALSL